MRTVLISALVLTAGVAFAESRTLTADVWVDNWFEMHVNGGMILEDSVPITTERSFNAETTTFTADLPMTVAIMAKDFKENDTGLEYIGTNRQQTGEDAAAPVAPAPMTTTSASILPIAQTWRSMAARPKTGRIGGAVMAVENPMLPLLDALIPGNAAWPSASLALRDVGPFLDSLTEDEREWLDGLACGLTQPPPIARRQLLAAEAESPVVFSAVLAKLYHAYYHSPVVARRVAALADQAPREPSPHVDPLLVANVVARGAGRRRL